MVNRLQAPQGNTAGPLTLSPLVGADPDGIVASFVITALPVAGPNGVSPGILYYNGVPVTVGQRILAVDADKLKFDPASGFSGNAFFSYTATDNAGLDSQPALYTIPVGADNLAVYKGITKGGNANQYMNGDVVGYGIDPNGALYNTSGLVYNADGTPAAGTVNNGIMLGKLSVADSTALAAIGVRYTYNTGLFTVVDRTKLPRGGRSITVSITTEDLFGGITVQPFTLVLGGNPLPVELTAFTATAKNLDAMLAWTTASEKNSAYFDVERSLNGTDFVKIDQVLAQGTSTRAIDYTRPDAGIGAKAATVYYRLKQVDLDGTSSYSPVRTVRFGKVVPAIALYPNPATSATQLDLTALPAGSYQVSVLDATGRVVLYTTLQAGFTHALNLNTIASGTYTLLVRGQDGGPALNLTKRLVKE